MRFGKYLGLSVAAIEWYDCAICVSLTQVISNVFFPAFDPVTRFILYFSSFAIGYLGRPLGALLFGFYSDKYSRLKSAYLSFSLMIFSTLCVSLLPTYFSIGIFAPVAFVFLRFLQGIAIGGNYGVSIYSVENAHRAERYFASSMICVGFMVGFFFGSVSTAALNYLFTPAFLQSMGWRIALWSSFCLSMPIFFVFPKIIQANDGAKKPIAVKSNEKVDKNIVFIVIAILLLDMVPFYLFFLFLPNYKIMFLQHGAVAIWAQQALAMFVMMAATPFFGKMADAYGPLKVLKITAVGLVLTAIFAPWNHWLWFCCFGVQQAACYGCLYGVVALVFPEHIRARVSSVILNATGAICGGATPIVATFLSQYNIRLIGAFLAAIGLCAWVALVRLSKKKLDL